MQWVKDVVLPQLWYRLQLRLEFDPWPGNQIPYGMGAAIKKKKKSERMDLLFIEMRKSMKEADLGRLSRFLVVKCYLAIKGRYLEEVT